MLVHKRLRVLLNYIFRHTFRSDSRIKQRRGFFFKKTFLLKTTTKGNSFYLNPNMYCLVFLLSNLRIIKEIFGLPKLTMFIGNSQISFSKQCGSKLWSCVYITEIWVANAYGCIWSHTYFCRDEHKAWFWDQEKHVWYSLNSSLLLVSTGVYWLSIIYAQFFGMGEGAEDRYSGRIFQK